LLSGLWAVQVAKKEKTFGLYRDRPDINRMVVSKNPELLEKIYNELLCSIQREGYNESQS
jgi:hypothetical protein